ncbi:MAG: hypothetical protein KBC69_03690 [Candidatus Magasanikbacteria bacterium]|nr:hypothetical protein [Candidatus Magasanikbacteria bacterium]
MQANKNRFGAKLSALLVTILTLGSLPLANISYAKPSAVVGFEGASAVVTTEGNTAYLHIQATNVGTPVPTFNADLSYTITGAADPNSDFLFNGTSGVTGGTVHMDSGTLTIPMALADDSTVEGPEIIIVTLTGISEDANYEASIGSSDTFTITIDDNTGLPYVNFASAVSANTEDQPGLVRVTLSRPLAQNVEFQWTADGNNPATAINIETVLGGNTFPADFTNAPIAFKTETILAGQTYIDLNLGVQNDTLHEQNETISLLLGSPITNAQFGSQMDHTYIIVDNDTPTIQFNSNGSSGDEGVNSHEFAITLSNPSSEETEITLEIDSQSTAQMGDLSIDGNDWNLPNAMRIIPAGQTSLPVTIQIKDDSLAEANETAIVSVKVPTQMQSGSPVTYTYTITDNETPVSSGAGGTAIPQSTASVGGVPVASVVVVPTPVVTAPVVTTPSPTTQGQVLGVQTSLVNELIAQLKFGSTSDQVNQLQVELQKLGFFPAKAKTTRYYGLMTKAAVQKYLDAKFGTMSLGELVSVLKFGQKSNAVKKLQNELKAAGFFPANSTATGFYGNLTKQAVANYLAR